MKLKNHNTKDVTHLFWIKNIFIVILFAYFTVINIIKVDQEIIKWTWRYEIWLPITTYVVMWEGRKYFKIYRNIFRFILNMDTLIGLASHTLYLYSVVNCFINYDKPMYEYDVMWEGAAFLITITNIGHTLEEKIKNSSKQTYDELNKIKKTIVMLENGGSIEVRKLKVGDIIIVPKGDMVPLDGVILGSSLFDYSNITGESKKIKIENGFVLSGSFNMGNSIKIKIERDYDNSTITKIINGIEAVSLARPKMQKFADKILKYFVPIILILSITNFTIWLTLEYALPNGINLPWLKTERTPIGQAIFASVVVLAIACPCALGIATPLVYTVSSLLANKLGAIISKPEALEMFSKIDVFAFDKTGTITSDDLEIVSIDGDKNFICIAKGLEAGIKHPIANEIRKIKGHKEVNINGEMLADNKGVSGRYKNKNYEIRSIDIKDTVTTNVALYENNKPVLIFSFSNKIKDGVKEVIDSLKAKNIKTIMITGDNEKAANYVAQQVGIDKVYANVSPSEKAKIIKEEQKNCKVAFVGDGFNDSISMKQADISIAFSSGSDITNSLADISITNDFKTITNIIKLSKMNNSNVRTALGYAFVFNVIAIPVALLLLIQPWVGASIMALSNVLVATNAYAYKKIGEKKLKIK